MNRRGRGIALVAVVVASAGFGAGTAVAGDAPPWLAALNARSEALNEAHRIGANRPRRALGAPRTSWLDALNARSDALNRRYGLGEYAKTG